MTDLEKAEVYDHISEIVASTKQTEIYFRAQKDMGSHIETVQAHAFRKIAKTFFADA